MKSRYCYNCKHITVGDPLFCESCGRSFDLKLCPRLHPNPRRAEVCSRCGSRELSLPQPKVAFGWRVLEGLLRMFLGAFLILATVLLLFEFIAGILETPSGQVGLFVIALLIAVLAWLWGKLPEWLRDFVWKQFRKRRKRHEDE
jgi:RNA polymerase subunit RPABC4/transcription elongation factor Spt4